MLIIFFAWLAMKSASALLGVRPTADEVLLSALGWAAAFYVFSAPLFVGEVLVAALLYRQRLLALRLGRALVAAEALVNLGMLGVTALHREQAVAFYAASREARGLPQSPEKLAQLFSGGALAAMALGTLLFWALVAWSLQRQKRQLH